MNNSRKMVKFSVSIASIFCITTNFILNSKADVPKPDLIISSVVESGNKATITIKNIGTANSGICVLRSEYWNGSWSLISNALVGALVPGATTVLVVNNANVSALNNRYTVDSTKAIAELNENNNIRETPGVQ